MNLYQISLRNAEYCIRNGLPYEIFLCCIPSKKREIWEKAKNKLSEQKLFEEV